MMPTIAKTGGRTKNTGREAQFLGLTWPEFLQVLANANDPAWPTFATRKDNEAATNAAWEALQRWQEGKKN